MPPPALDVTALLRAWSDGDPDALDKLAPVVYDELRRRAAAYLRHERQGHTLQPTAVVHEAFLRLMNQHRTKWENRAQFFAIASRMMRRVLVDHARARETEKRSGRWSRIALVEGLASRGEADIQLFDLDRALTRLEALDPRKARIAELRFFGGLSLEETASALEVSRATVEREWQAARAWLFRELSGQPSP